MRKQQVLRKMQAGCFFIYRNLCVHFVGNVVR